MLKFKYCILKIIAFTLWTIVMVSFGEQRYELLTKTGCSTITEWGTKYIKKMQSIK